MPRKQRDYKAEYQASKQRALASGYKSEREYKRVRRELKLPPRTSPIPKRVLQRNTDIPITVTAHNWQLRRDAKAWSAKHSHRRNSRYRDNLSDDQLERYYRAFVEPLPKGPDGKAEKRRRLKEYLVPDFLSESEWEANPSTVPLRR